MEPGASPSLSEERAMWAAHPESVLSLPPGHQRTPALPSLVVVINFSFIRVPSHEPAFGAQLYVRGLHPLVAVHPVPQGLRLTCSWPRSVRKEMLSALLTQVIIF